MKEGGHLSLSLRVMGFVGSLILTLGAFFLILYSSHFSLRLEMVIGVLLVLALLQAAVQSFCFLHLWKEKGTPWNLIMFLSTIGMIVIIIVGSIWIMHHLNANMMPYG
jgi:cytochrome o ubiquinol oxidase operon protein cyoD